MWGFIYAGYGAQEDPRGVRMNMVAGKKMCLATAIMIEVNLSRLLAKNSGMIFIWRWAQMALAMYGYRAIVLR
jgi:hypothetical protein